MFILEKSDVVEKIYQTVSFFVFGDFSCIKIVFKVLMSSSIPGIPTSCKYKTALHEESLY